MYRQTSSINKQNNEAVNKQQKLTTSLSNVIMANYKTSHKHQRAASRITYKQLESFTKHCDV